MMKNLKYKRDEKNSCPSFPLVSTQPSLKCLSTIVTTNIYSWWWFTIEKIFRENRAKNFFPHSPQMQFSASLSRELHKLFENVGGSENVSKREKKDINEWNRWQHFWSLIQWSSLAKVSFLFFNIKSDTQMRRRSFLCVCDMRRFSGSRKKNISMFFSFFSPCPDNKYGKLSWEILRGSFWSFSRVFSVES